MNLISSVTDACARCLTAHILLSLLGYLWRKYGYPKGSGLPKSPLISWKWRHSTLKPMSALRISSAFLCVSVIFEKTDEHYLFGRSTNNIKGVCSCMGVAVDFGFHLKTLWLTSPVYKMTKIKKIIDEAKETKNPELELVDKGLSHFDEIPGICRCSFSFSFFLEIIFIKFYHHEALQAKNSNISWKYKN